MLPSILSSPDDHGDDDFRVVFLERTELATARQWILAVGAWYLVSCALFLLLRDHAPTPAARDQVVLTNVALFVAQLALWWWVDREPRLATIVALGLFVTVIVVDAAIEPSSLWRGLLVKVLGVAALVRAVQAGISLQRLRGQRVSRAGTS